MTVTLPSRSILRRGFLLLLAAMALLVLADAGTTSAQTSTTLIKNTSQSTVPLVEGLDLFDYAQRFRTGGAPHGYVVTSVGLPFRAVADASVAYTVSIHRLVGGGTSPGTRVGQLTRPGSLAANSVNTWTGPGIYLAPNTDYFVVVDSSSGAVNLLSQTASDNEDAGGASGWSIDNGGRFRGRSSSGTWGTSANSLQLQIGGYARAATPLVGTVLQPNQGDYNLGTHDRAQSFRTGASTSGYMLHGVGLFVSDVTNASVSYEVTITTAFTSGLGNLRPNTVLATLTAPATLTADSLNVWRSPRGVYLAPNTDYFVIVDSSSAANNYLEITQSDAEDGGGHAGWSVGNDLIDRNRVGGIWSDDGIFSLKLQLTGYARAAAGTSPPTTPVVNSDPASPTTLSVSWRAPDHAVNLPVTSYDVQYRVQGSTAAWTNGPQDRTTTAASLTGLTEGTAYEVQVRATGSEGDSAWSASGYGTAGAQASAFVVGNTLRANEFVTNPIVSTHDVFQPFTTGSRADGYRITSVDLLFLHVADQGVSPPNVGIYVDRGSGLPGDRVGALFTRPARLVGANDGVNTWTSPGIDLQPGTTYLLGVIGGGSAAHIVRNSRSVNEDAGGLEGWSVGDSQNWRTRGTSSYSPIAKSLKMRLSGHTVGDSQPDTQKLITNTGQPPGSFVYLSSQDVAQSFRTGGNADGYTLTSVTLEFVQVVDRSVSYPVAIYTVNGGRPNQFVASLNPPTSLNEFSVSRNNTWTSPGIYLAPNTDYVVFLDLSGGPDNRLATTGSDNEDSGGAAGWSIANNLVRRNHDSTGFFFAEANSLKIEIAGFARDTSTPLPPTTPLVNSNPDSPTTLTATWRRPDVPVNLTVSYDLRYRVRGATTWSQGSQDLANASGTITGITAGTTYEVQVRASDGQGDSIWTASGYGTAGGEGSGLIIGNTGQANEFSDNTNLLTHDVFQPFTTGPSHEGYRVTNLEVMFLHVEAGRRGTVPNIAIFEERSPPGSGLPGTQVGIFTRPVRVVAGNDGLNVWTSPGIDLDPSTTYLLGVVSTGNAPHILRNTTSASADGGASPGWSIVFGHNKRPVGTSTYPPVFKSLKMRVYGYAERGNPPVFGQRSYSRTVDENSAGGVNVGDPITATDADGDTLTYSLGGNDAASFNVNAATGQITTKDGVTYDHEGKNTFRLTITATDGITPVSANVSIALNNINEPGDNPCGPDPIEPRTFDGWTKDERGRYDADEEPPGSYRGTLQERCYNGGHRTNTRYHLYEFTLAEQAKVMLVLESDLRQLTPDEYVDGDPDTPGFQPVFVRFGSYVEWFDPYLILLRNDGDNRTFVADNDDINGEENKSSALIRTLAAGTYTVYATSYSQGVGGAFRLFYFHEDSDNDPALVLPERRVELGGFTDYSFLLERKEYGPEHLPLNVAVSDTGLVTWEIDRDLLEDGDGYGVKWWVRTAPKGDNYRNARVKYPDFRIVNVSSCSGDDCSFQIPDFDPDLFYPVEIDMADWYYSPRVPAAHAPPWRVRISEDGVISWWKDRETTAGQYYWVSWRSGDGPPADVRYGDPNQGFARVNENRCGSDGVCRHQIPNFDSDLHWLAQVWPQRNNPLQVKWPGRWPAPEQPQEPAVPTLTGLSAAEVDQDGTVLDVSWNSLTNADEYLVQWKTGTDDYNTGVERTETSYRITGLTAGTTYTVQVSAIDTDEDPQSTLATSEVQGTTWSDRLRFGADTYQFSVAENAEGGTDVGDPLTARGAASGATVSYSLGGDDAASFDIDDGTGQISTRSGVDYDYETKSAYSLTVNADDGASTATATVTVTLTDVEEPPDAPGAPNVSSASATSLAVSWLAPGNSGRPPITDYDVQYRAGDSGAWSTWTHDGVAASATITDLTTGSEYQVQVLATNAEGSSPWSATGSGVPGTLVRNLGQAHGPSDRISHLAFDTAQSFTTGSAENGYTVTGVEIGYADVADTNVSPSVAIYTSASGRPGTLVGTLIAAGLLRPQAVNRWTHAGLDLAKDTTYFVIIDSAEVSNWVAYTSSDDEDSGASAGWTIGNEGAIRAQASTGSWTPFSGSLRIDIRGAAKAGPGLSGPPDESRFVIYHDPDAGAAAVSRYDQAVALLDDAGIGYTEVTGDVQGDADRLAGVTNSVLPRFFLGDPTDSDWTSEPGENNGGLRWLKAKVAELTTGPADSPPEPVALAGLTVNPVAGKTTELAVSWTAVTDADKYLVQWKTGPADFNTGDESTNATHTITGLSANTAYTVKVSAIDTGSDPHLTLATGEAGGTTLAAMGTVTVTPVSGSDDSLDASWPAVSGATGYVVEYKTSGGSYQSVTRSSATATTERITGLSAETAYTVRVTARHTIGGVASDGDSAEGSATTNAPPPPPGPAALQGLTINPVAGKTTELAVSWTAVTDADEYLVQWKTGSAEFNTGDESTDATHTITGLSAGATYTVKVTAIDTDASPDAELATGEASGTTLAAMGTVTVEAVSGSDDSLDASWPAVSGATGYVVEYKTSGGSYQSVTRSDATATTERITGLDAETAYTVRVTARHSIGGVASDGDSAEGSGTTNAAAPVGPESTTDEVAPALKVSFSVVGLGTFYFWDAMETVGGNPVTAYTIEWATSIDGPWTALDAPGEGSRCVPRMAAKDEGNSCYFEYSASVSPASVTVGGTYYFRLIAHAGNVSTQPGPVLEDTL